MNIMFLLLGCNIYSILLNRLETSIKFIESINYDDLTQSFLNYNDIVSNLDLKNITQTQNKIKNKIEITWFLSGGVKNNFANIDIKSEASVMKSQIDNIINLKYNTNKNTQNSNVINFNHSYFEWNYVLDEKSTNTAENFIWASHFLNTSSKSFDLIYVITSNFHYQRANQMLKLIDPSRNYKWILGELEETDSRYWESLHIKNILSDVNKAKDKLKLLV